MGTGSSLMSLLGSLSEKQQYQKPYRTAMESFEDTLFFIFWHKSKIRGGLARTGGLTYRRCRSQYRLQRTPPTQVGI